MELSDLAGEHILDAVDFSNENIKTWGDSFEQCQVMRFRLDGIVYQVVEDPSDGYRSSMRDITVSEAEMTNVFEGVRIVGRHRTSQEYQTDDILELIDIANGNVILEAGTENTEDYYPSFVANFTPERMAINARNLDADRARGREA